MSRQPDSLAHLADSLREVLNQLPRQPGVYLLKGRGDEVLYVGKATDLRARVRSYFLPSTSDDRPFFPSLQRLVRDVETVVTRNVKEALLLENTLIKQHQPRLNVKLRDDKSYLVLRLDPAARFPRLEVKRSLRRKDDGARYFGPYHSAVSCRQTLRLVNRHFQLRTCTDRTLSSRSRPCLQYQIQRCLAPCVLEVDEAEYAGQVRDVTLFLRGKGAQLIEDLKGRMARASEALEFEVAARLRDQIEALRGALMGQQVVGEDLTDRDVFGYFREGDRLDAVVLIIRRGKLTGRRPFSLSGQEFPDEEMLAALVSRYYDRGEEVPRQVLLPLPLEDAPARQQWLSELRGTRVELRVPQRGAKRQLLELATRNARSNFESRRRREQDMEAALAKLERRLRLSRPPRRIECYDISHLQLRSVVASMVVLLDGEPAPAEYRKFKINAPEKDDFAAMYEVLSRRLRRAREGDPGWELPDLVLVDGGKAQLSMAVAALRDVGLAPGATPPDLVALAKERPGPDAQGEERPDRVFRPGVKDPVRLRPNTAELFLLARARDEAHRFAVTYHKALRRRRALRSGLEDIPGIGPKRRKTLLKELGSLKRVRAATVEELAAVPGMTMKAAENVARYFAAPGAEDNQ